MPINFGSFGDIVAVLQLAWQLRAALSTASGASAEIRVLVTDVDSFTRALQQTKAAIEQRHTPLAPAVENGIKHAIIACHDVLRVILDKVDAFRLRMTSRIGAIAWRQYWAVAAWSILGGKKDVEALRMRLSEQIGVVQTYLSLAQSNDQSKVHETVDRHGAALDRIYSVMQDIQLRFDVGVPAFHFFGPDGRYYPPFARTSFQRPEYYPMPYEPPFWQTRVIQGDVSTWWPSARFDASQKMLQLL
ncbi:hypothetical protein AURDEDRAFT_176298 [Auricularia subglabra TFB-10046 SS5]|uniref:Fungal N-terminal domain-containing protein n=1 Tax=Auricularia subglabra (strain TFB-10046 / SS5) TaxID=717982 RepID=J0CW00_AURST|nr:hypothetical protein AURDEDRAFT_176298 [Auricularia subglabra TFB-10046 SS5]